MDYLEVIVFNFQVFGDFVIFLVTDFWLISIAVKEYTLCDLSSV